MPKLKATETEILDAHLRKAIKGSAGYFQLDIESQAEIVGVKRATWYRRINMPSSFSLAELRRMVEYYSWDARTVCQFLGVKERSWDI